MLHQLTLSITLLLTLCSVTWSDVQFDGSTGYLTMGTSSIYQFPNTTFTVLLWFKSNNDDGYVIARRGIGSPIGGWFFRIDAGGTGTARIVDIGSGVAGGRTTVSTTLKDGNWHCLGVVYTTDTAGTANDVTIYYDGVLDQGGPGGPSTYSAVTQPLVLGATSDLDSSGWLNGSIAEVRIYGSGLSAENVARYCAAKVKFGGFQFSNLISYWPLDACGEGASGSGVTLNDVAKGGSNGVGTGGVTCHGSTVFPYAGGAE